MRGEKTHDRGAWLPRDGVAGAGVLLTFFFFFFPLHAKFWVNGYNGLDNDILFFIFAT